MVKKLMLLLTAGMLVVSLTACSAVSNTNKNNENPTATPIAKSEIKENKDIVENGSDHIQSEKTVETDEKKPVESVEPDNEVSKESGIHFNISIVNPDDEMISSLNDANLDTWSWLRCDGLCVTFPSTKPVDGDNVYEITTEEEYGDYIVNNSDVWSIKDDYWTISKEEFNYHHDNFFNISWKSTDTGILYYFVVESADFDLAHSLEIDEDRMLYDEKKDILYLFLINSFKYTDYMSILNKDIIDSMDDITASNRLLLTIDMKQPERFPVSQIILVKPEM